MNERATAGEAEAGLETDARGGGWRGRTVRLTVIAALAVAAGCAALLAGGRCGTVRSPSVSVSTGPGESAGSAGPAASNAVPGAATATPAAPEQHSSRPSPTSSTALPAAASSAPISASALVQFKVTSHGGDGYRAAVTVGAAGH